MFVSIHPTQLGKPVKVWDGVNIPLGITANSKGDILVAELAGNIIKFDANGQRHKLVTQNELKTLLCIAVDDEDNIYCIDQSNNKILTCDKNGGNVQVHEVKASKGSGRRALSIVNNELLISEADSRGTIMVYDRELKYVRCMQHKDMGLVNDISADVHGNLYVTDHSNACIQVFGSNGAFIRSLCRDKNILGGPWGVCVSGQYVYVTDIANHCVSVFTTDDVYVTSFGQRGDKEGDFNHPYLMYIDKDQFVYVSDYLNLRIQCF